MSSWQRLAAAITYAWLSCAALMPLPALASQASLVTPSAPLPMTALASFLNAAFLSIGSCNSGNSAPTNGTGASAFPGECWINTTSNPWVFSYTVDGTHWSEFGTLNTSTFAWTPFSNGGALGNPVTVGQGGTGTGSGFTANLPLLGGGGAASLIQGSVTGTTTKFATSTGALTPGDCIKLDTNLNFVDAGAQCGASNNAPYFQYFSAAASTLTLSGAAGTGSISGATLTISACTTCSFVVGQQIIGNAIPNGVWLSALGSGSGGAGTYTLSQSLTVASEAITAPALPTAAGMTTVLCDGRAQARNTWSVNTSTGVVTFNNACSSNTQIVEVDWWAPSTLAGVGSLTIGASTLSGAINMIAGSGITLTPSGQNLTIASSGSGGVSSLTNNDGTLTLSGSTGAVTVNSTYFYKCTGTDLSALNTLTASGIHALILLGACGVTAGLNQLPTNFAFGGLDPLNDYISTSSANSNTVILASGDTVRNLGITASVSRSGGANLYMSGVVNITLDNLYLANIFDGIRVNGAGSPAGLCPISFSPCSGVHGHAIRIYGPASGSPEDGILIYGASGASQPWNTDISFDQVFISGADTSAYLQNGVEIQTAGDVHFNHLQTIYSGSSFGVRSGAGWLLNPAGAAATGHIIQWAECSDCLFDSGGGSGAVISAISGAVVDVAKLVNSWSSSNASGNGVQIYTDTGAGSAIGEVDIDGDTIGGNTNGVNNADSANIVYLNVSNSCVAGSSNDGIYLGLSANGFRINNNKVGFCSGFGGNAVGLSCSGTASPSESMVLGTDFSGNTTNTSCAWSMAVRANNINY